MGKKNSPVNRLTTATTILLILHLLLGSCATPEYACNDPLGCLEIPSGSPIVIGAIFATSGEQNRTGAESLRSVENIIAEHGEIFGHSLHLIKYGTDCTPDSARAGATEFATNPNLSAVIGPTCTDEAGVARTILLEAGIPILGPVPDPLTATEITNRIIAAIKDVIVQGPGEILYIPRQSLIDELNRTTQN